MRWITLKVGSAEIEIGGPMGEDDQIALASDADLLSYYSKIYNRPDEEPERIYQELYERGIVNPLNAIKGM